MQRVAVITDIHANLPALQAALARIDDLGLDAIYCGGDPVGYGPHPNEVCALIAERGIPTIYGNYDYAIPDGLRLRVHHAARPRARAALGRLDARPHRRAEQELHAHAAVRPALRPNLEQLENAISTVRSLHTPRAPARDALRRRSGSPPNARARTLSS